jgi:protein farnesyltransferase subunit beta
VPRKEGDGEFDGPDSVWAGEPYMDEVQIFEEEDRVVPIHPVYVIPQRHVDDIKRYFAGKEGF